MVFFKNKIPFIYHGSIQNYGGMLKDYFFGRKKKKKEKKKKREFRTTLFGKRIYILTL